jgi:hypothetical protein
MSQEPKYTRTILCLANSRRPGGRCVAGKAFADGATGAWLRPVNAENQNAISEMDLQYEDGKSADVLDIIEIPLIEAKPLGHQAENHLITPDYYWTKQDDATWAQIVNATDNVKGPLWSNTESSHHGLNDKIPEALANTLTGSLLLINPTRLDLVVGPESKYGGGTRRRVRAAFQFNGAAYNFVVTDPFVEAKYFAGKDGTFRIAESRLCVSLSEVIGGNAIKLAATVITPDRVDGQ